MNTIVIIVAAGSGSRYGGPLPKQFCMLAGRPVLMHTIDAFRLALPEAKVLVVLSDDMTNLWADMCSEMSYAGPQIITGGATRYHSVRNALDAIADADDTSIVLIHDGARPIVSPHLIANVTGRLLQGDVAGVVPAIAVTDSLRRVLPDNDRLTCAVARAGLYAVQTPQAFTLATISKAYAAVAYSDALTDDASVVEAAGLGRIAIAEGDSRNIKITRPGDIDIAAQFIKGV